jgi:hypothetical protein
MLTTLLIVVAVLVIGVLLVAATRPADVRVSRTAALAAPPSAVFPHLNDLRKLQDWSPWAKLDPPTASSPLEVPPSGSARRFPGRATPSGPTTRPSTIEPETPSAPFCV